MGEVLMCKEHYIFTTTTAEVRPPNDFVVEFITDVQDMNKKDSVIKINNLDELLDFLEDTDW